MYVLIFVYYWVMDYDSIWLDKNICLMCILDYGLFLIIVIKLLKCIGIN